MADFNDDSDLFSSGVDGAGDLSGDPLPPPPPSMTSSAVTDQDDGAPQQQEAAATAPQPAPDQAVSPTREGGAAQRLMAEFLSLLFGVLIDASSLQRVPQKTVVFGAMSCRRDVFRLDIAGSIRYFAFVGKMATKVSTNPLTAVLEVSEVNVGKVQKFNFFRGWEYDERLRRHELGPNYEPPLLDTQALGDRIARIWGLQQAVAAAASPQSADATPQAAAPTPVQADWRCEAFDALFERGLEATTYEEKARVANLISKMKDSFQRDSSSVAATQIAPQPEAAAAAAAVPSPPPSTSVVSCASQHPADRVHYTNASARVPAPGSQIHLQPSGSRIQEALNSVLTDADNWWRFHFKDREVVSWAKFVAKFRNPEVADALKGILQTSAQRGKVQSRLKAAVELASWRLAVLNFHNSPLTNDPTDAIDIPTASFVITNQRFNGFIGSTDAEVRLQQQGLVPGSCVLRVTAAQASQSQGRLTLSFVDRGGKVVHLVIGRHAPGERTLGFSGAHEDMLVPESHVNSVFFYDANAPEGQRSFSIPTYNDLQTLLNAVARKNGFNRLLCSGSGHYQTFKPT